MPRKQPVDGRYSKKLSQLEGHEVREERAETIAVT
jgi:hypothetical protein